MKNTKVHSLYFSRREGARGNRRFPELVARETIQGYSCLYSNRRPQAGKKNFLGVVLEKYKVCSLYFL